ncbi:MAG: hypothetical protein HY744_14645, partial [Deltaproteobacteria bacterium]|nr:hypothetical protein [Deltaproteobacteria bacterium]
LDIWICGDRFRLAMPAIGLRQRGDGSTPAEELRALPVGFLRAWLLRPLAGRLLVYAPRGADGRERFVVRDGEAVFDLHAARHALWLRRAGGAASELIDAEARRCGKARYRQPQAGIDIAIHCEKLERGPAAGGRAFVDPDDPTARCVGTPASAQEPP